MPSEGRSECRSGVVLMRNPVMWVWYRLTFPIWVIRQERSEMVQWMKSCGLQPPYAGSWWGRQSIRIARVLPKRRKQDGTTA